MSRNSKKYVDVLGECHVLQYKGRQPSKIVESLSMGFEECIIRTMTVNCACVCFIFNSVMFLMIRILPYTDLVINIERKSILFHLNISSTVQSEF